MNFGLVIPSLLVVLISLTQFIGTLSDGHLLSWSLSSQHSSVNGATISAHKNNVCKDVNVQFWLKPCLDTKLDGIKVAPTKFPPIKANVPGDIHSNLQEANIIGDPYYRYEELNLAWITETCWEYVSEEFTLPGESEDQALYLNFDEIDTIADIYLNEQHIGFTNSSFHPWNFRIGAGDKENQETTVLRSGKQRVYKLRVALYSSLNYTKDKAESYPYTVPHTQNYNVWTEPSHRNFIRKAGSDFGWDWGPAFIETGLTGSIKFYQFQHKDPQSIGLVGGRLKEINVFVAKLDVSKRVAEVSVLAYLECLSDESLSLIEEEKFDLDTVVSYFTVKLKGDIVLNKAKSLRFDGEKKEIIVEFSVITVKDIHLWWPKDLFLESTSEPKNAKRESDGIAYLYDVTVIYLDQELMKNFGFRTVELVQSQLNYASSPDGKLLDPYSSSFYFKINEVEVFMRGANFIPIDSFKSRISMSDREYIYQVASQSNMNMLRVWGGGI